MASAGRGTSSTTAVMRKKRRTIGGFRAHAMGESFDHNTTADASGNFSLSMVPEDQLSCLGEETGSSGRENIVVAVRVRPLSASEVAEGKRSCCDVLTRNTLVIRKGADPGAYLRSQKGSSNEYSFDAVFPPEAGQSEVYEGTAKPHISELLEGINVTVFAYGATGAGKTHTMMGSERVVGARSEGGSEEVSGIVPQSLVELFHQLEERVVAGSGDEDETESWAVRVGYLQVYNEQIMDLLSPSSKALKINEDPSKGVVVVAGLTETEVTSSEEVLDLLRQGNANRRTEATGANQVSSRSHAVLQVVVTRTLESSAGSKSVRDSKLSLIDLAGSERASATNNRGEQLRQGANINKSLLSLANCINALAGNRRRRGGKGAGNVKYRDSKLTHLLKASLEGRCRLVMIANVNPSHVFFDDSHNTLKYANRAKNIKPVLVKANARCAPNCDTSIAKVDPRTTESVKGLSGLMTEGEARLAREYQALKERNQQVEAQLESMKNSRGYMAPEPVGFTDLFAPNTSSIMSVASSTPGHADRYAAAPQHPPPPPPLPPAQAPPSGVAAIGKIGGGGGSGGGGMRTRRSGGVGRGTGTTPGSTMPPPIPRGGGAEGSRGGGLVDEDREAVTDSGEFCSGEPSPEIRRVGAGGRSATPPTSGSKRKRERGGRGEEEAGGSAERKREELWGELAAERIRVRELEGKVRELESSMARMGAQQDVNMELIDTFRDQKDSAEEAAECERATADELLGLLKEKEGEITHLREELAELTRTVALESSSSSVAVSAGADGRRSADEEYDSRHGVSGGSSSFRSGLLTEGNSALGPLGQIEENGGAGAEAAGTGVAVEDVAADVGGYESVSRREASTYTLATSEGHTAGSSSGGVGGGGVVTARVSERSPSPSLASGRSTVEVASAIQNQRRKSSMIPRSRKSMIPAPRSSGRSSSARRLGDVTNSSSTRLNDHLSSGTPSGVKKRSRLGTLAGTSCGNSDVSADFGSSSSLSASVGGISVPGAGESRVGKGRNSSRRVSSRTGSTPQRMSVAGRTRSRLSMAPPCSVRDVR